MASASLQVAKKIGAHFIITSGSAGTQPNDDTTAIVSKHLKIYGSILGSREEFRQLMSFMAVKQIKPIVDSVFPLREAAAAQQHLEAGREFGKIVLQISARQRPHSLTGRQIFGDVPAGYPLFAVGLPPYREGHGRKGRRNQRCHSHSDP